MTINDTILLSAVGAVAIVLLFVVVRVLIMTSHINGAFAKLGFIVREDAKKYFDDAAGKIVDTNDRLSEQYRKVVEESTKKVLADSGGIMEHSVAEAQARAGQIILQAQTDAQRIIGDARERADQERQMALTRTVDAVSWTMQQYLKKGYDASQHEELIQQIITTYVNEHRK